MKTVFAVALVVVVVVVRRPAGRPIDERSIDAAAVAALSIVVVRGRKSKCGVGRPIKNREDIALATDSSGCSNGVRVSVM